MSLIDYSTEARLVFTLDEISTKYGALDALGLSFHGGTSNTASAIDMITSVLSNVTYGERNHTSNLGIIITDGRSDDPPLTWSAAMAARSTGDDLLVIGVGKACRADDTQFLHRKSV